MTREEIIEQLNLTIGLIKQDGKDWLDDRDIPMLEECVKALSQEPKNPCDVCMYNPPSSTDGKPCTMCPATAKGEWE